MTKSSLCCNQITRVFCSIFHVCFLLHLLDFYLIYSVCVIVIISPYRSSCLHSVICKAGSSVFPLKRMLRRVRQKRRSHAVSSNYRWSWRIIIIAAVIIIIIMWPSKWGNQPVVELGPPSTNRRSRNVRLVRLLFLLMRMPKKLYRNRCDAVKTCKKKVAMSDGCFEFWKIIPALAAFFFHLHVKFEYKFKVFWLKLKKIKFHLNDAQELAISNTCLLVILIWSSTFFTQFKQRWRCSWKAHDLYLTTDS